MDWTHELLEQLEFHWQHQLRPRLDGLTDDEYLWEPVPGAWSLRERDGHVVADFVNPPPDPEPVTTIAWRLGHISVGVLGMRASNHFGDGSLSYETAEWSRSADGGLAMLDEAYAAWVAGVRTLDEAALAEPCGPAEGPYAHLSMAALILHINRETIHHGAEVALLRDLYRAQVPVP